MNAKQPLKDLIYKPISGEWGKDPEGKNGVKVIRTTNFTNFGKLEIENKEVVIRDIEQKKIENKKLIPGDIIIEKSGGSPTQPVGRVVFFNNDAHDDFMCNNFTSIIRVKSQNLHPKYLFYYLFYLHQSGVTQKYQNKTTGIINLKLDRYLSEIKIPIITVEEQKLIVERLDIARELIEKKEDVIQKYNSLRMSLFYNYFGDPVLNNNDYPTVSGEEIIDFMTSGSRGWSKFFTTNGEKFITIKNVKDGVLSFKDTTYVNAPKSAEAKRTKVNEGDLLISITADLGRTAIVDDETAENGAYINQHLCIIRLNKQIVHPIYVSYFLESVGGKRQFEMLDRTGVKSGLNFDNIKELKILLPPIEKQKKFGGLITDILNKQKSFETSLEKLNNTFQSLLNFAFNKELIIQKVR
jgi:type I restriction enzyme, S subunit